MSIHGDAIEKKWAHEMTNETQGLRKANPLGRSVSHLDLQLFWTLLCFAEERKSIPNGLRVLHTVKYREIEQ